MRGFQWLVLGIPRLHHTIASLGVTSKTGAGHYALGVVDSRWHAASMPRSPFAPTRARRCRGFKTPLACDRAA
jgi:hypothetical protein